MQVGPFRAYIDTIDDDGSRGWLQQAVKMLHQGRFTGAGDADDGGATPPRYIQRDIRKGDFLQRSAMLVGIDMCQLVGADDRLAHWLSSRAMASTVSASFEMEKPVLRRRSASSMGSGIVSLSWRKRERLEKMSAGRPSMTMRPCSNTTMRCACTVSSRRWVTCMMVRP